MQGVGRIPTMIQPICSNMTEKTWTILRKINMSSRQCFLGFIHNPSDQKYISNWIRACLLAMTNVSIEKCLLVHCIDRNMTETSHGPIGRRYQQYRSQECEDTRNPFNIQFGWFFPMHDFEREDTFCWQTLQSIVGGMGWIPLASVGLQDWLDFNQISWWNPLRS